jgi:uncharacterized membrane protein
VIQILRFFKTTVVGGLVFLLPFAFVFFLVSYVLRTLSPIFHRAAERLDVPLFRAATVAILIAVVVIFLACFLAGLIAQSRFGGRIRNWIASNLLGRVAAYRVIESIGEELGGKNANAMQVALVWTDGWQLAFVVERHGDGIVTVVVPEAPSATGGTILYLPEERVHVLDVKVADVLKVHRRMGFGSSELLGGKVPPLADA